MQQCTVDENCENEASSTFTWAWGEQGACCDAHRALLESKAQQLNRSISFEAVAATRRDYKRPTLQQLDPELGKLRMENASLREELQRQQATIANLEIRNAELQGEVDKRRLPGAEVESVIEGRPPPVERAPIEPPNKRR